LEEGCYQWAYYLFGNSMIGIMHELNLKLYGMLTHAKPKKIAKGEGTNFS